MTFRTTIYLTRAQTSTKQHHHFSDRFHSERIFIYIKKRNNYIPTAKENTVNDHMMPQKGYLPVTGIFYILVWPIVFGCWHLRSTVAQQHLLPFHQWDKLSSILRTHLQAASLLWSACVTMTQAHSWPGDGHTRTHLFTCLSEDIELTQCFS